MLVHGEATAMYADLNQIRAQLLCGTRHRRSLLRVPISHSPHLRVCVCLCLCVSPIQAGLSEARFVGAEAAVLCAR